MPRFAVVDDIYFTPKNICTVRVYTELKGSKFITKEEKRYYPKTKKNVSSALRIHGYIRNKKSK